VWEIDHFVARSWIALSAVALTVLLVLVTRGRSAKTGASKGTPGHFTWRGPAR
jgi:hypothetical protein